MRKVKIFVEGRHEKEKNEVHSSDARLLRDCIRHWFKKDLDLVNDFAYIGGASGIIRKTNQIVEERDRGHEVLLIIDANGDVERRKKEITDFRDKSALTFQYFLFPDNNRIGEVETLIENVATKREILKCFTDYEKCIGKNLNIKDKIYAYIEAASDNPDDAKETNRNFNTALFDLNHETLNPLKEFLKPFFA